MGRDEVLSFSGHDLLYAADLNGSHHEDDCPCGVDLWPTEADGLGKSLSRKVPTGYDDVANWKAADPPPGTTNP